jgi:hypothetical protein
LMGPPVWVVPTGLAALIVPRMPMNLPAGISLLGRTDLRELTSPLARMARPVSRGTLARTTLPVPPQGTLARVALPVPPQGTLARTTLPVPPQGTLARMALPVPPQGTLARVALPVPSQGTLARMALPVLRDTLVRMGRLELTAPLARMDLPTLMSPVRTGLAAPMRSPLVGVAKAV